MNKTDYTIGDITFIIQAFKRPKQLLNLIDSIKKYYPENKILIYDDSLSDRGLSWGRNFLVSQVTTKLYLLLDDDFFFTEDTKIEKLLDKLNKGYDLVSGVVINKGIIGHYEGRYKVIDRVLYYERTEEEPLDFVFNFFLAKNKVTGWDETLKLAEHTAFFFEHKGYWKIGYEPECLIDHRQFREEEYEIFRKRAKDIFNSWLKKKGFIKVVGFDGEKLDVK